MKKIGLLTLHNSYNYGALLQAYATYEFLRINNYDVHFIDYQNEYEKKYNKLFSYRKKLSIRQNFIMLIKNTIFRSFYYCNKSFKKFINKLPKTKRIEKEVSNLDGFGFDVIISGSDQIWNPGIFGDVIDSKYLLDFECSAKKISYASSLGSYVINENDKKIYKKCLNKFSSISVREEFAKKQLTQIVDRDIEVVCDPTMLLTKSDWISQIPQNVAIREKYILVYLMSKYEDYEELIINFAKEKKLKIALITFSDIKRNGVDFYFKGLNPFEFLSAINNAEYILTNSFHGSIFSIIFNKNFYAFHFDKNPKRIENLLEQFGIKDRIIKKYEDFDQCSKLNYGEINKKIDLINKKNTKWLIDAIEKSEVVLSDKKSRREE